MPADRGLEVLRSLTNRPQRRSLTASKKERREDAFMTSVAGTFDISCRNRDGVSSQATNGDTHLGAMMGWQVDGLNLDDSKKENGMDLRKQPDACSVLKKGREGEDRPVELGRFTISISLSSPRMRAGQSTSA